MKIFEKFAFFGTFVKGGYNRGDEIIHQGRSFFVGQSRINSPDSLQSSSLCYERITSGMAPCCDDINLQCYGCNSELLADGIPCEDQPIDTLTQNSRDCFCDASCIMFKDCCEDHPITCKHLYATTTESTTTTTTTTTTKTTTTTTTTTKTTTTTTTIERPTESWLFKRLFKVFGDLSAEKYFDSPRKSKMEKKIEHIYNWLLNAEHRCRHFIAPLIEDPDDGSFTEYNYYWGITGDKQQPIGGRLSTLGSAFQKYISDYYWDAPRKRELKTVKSNLRKGIQGCDGVKVIGLKHGKHFRTKRLLRKTAKMIKKFMIRLP